MRLYILDTRPMALITYFFGSVVLKAGELGRVTWLLFLRFLLFGGDPEHLAKSVTLRVALSLALV